LPSKKFRYLKPAIDVRYADRKVTSHAGNDFGAHPIEEVADIFARLKPDTTVVAIDEAQFFDMEIIEIVESLADRGLRVIVAGLDTDFRGEPFGPIPTLMAQSEHVDKLHAICMVCGEEASRTQRLVNGRPAHFNDPVVIIRASELYSALPGTSRSATRLIMQDYHEFLAEILIPTDRLQERILEMGEAISQDYEDKRLHLVCILRGGVLFLADLMRCISVPHTIDFMAVSSYGSGARKSTGQVRITLDLKETINDRDVLLIEDIVDSGYTIASVLELLATRHPRTLCVCALLDKYERREIEVPIHYRDFPYRINSSSVMVSTSMNITGICHLSVP
jgi:hypoxanthine phosphoribosyltransferase